MWRSILVEQALLGLSAERTKIRGEVKELSAERDRLKRELGDYQLDQQRMETRDFVLRERLREGLDPFTGTQIKTKNEERILTARLDAYFERCQKRKEEIEQGIPGTSVRLHDDISRAAAARSDRGPIVGVVEKSAAVDINPNGTNQTCAFASKVGIGRQISKLRRSSLPSSQMQDSVSSKRRPHNKAVVQYGHRAI